MSDVQSPAADRPVEKENSNFTSRIIGPQLKGQQQEPELPQPVPLQAGRELQEAMDWLGLLARPVVGARRGSPAYLQAKKAALLLTEILRLRAIGEVR